MSFWSTCIAQQCTGNTGLSRQDLVRNGQSTGTFENNCVLLQALGCGDMGQMEPQAGSGCSGQQSVLGPSYQAEFSMVRKGRVWTSFFKVNMSNRTECGTLRHCEVLSGKGFRWLSPTDKECHCQGLGPGQPHAWVSGVLWASCEIQSNGVLRADTLPQLGCMTIVQLCQCFIVSRSLFLSEKQRWRFVNFTIYIKHRIKLPNI